MLTKLSPARGPPEIPPITENRARKHQFAPARSDRAIVQTGLGSRVPQGACQFPRRTVSVAWYEACLGPARQGPDMHKTTVCRLALQVPAEVARMSPNDLALHVRTHWNEWQDKWRQVDGSQAPGEVVRVASGAPLFLIERAGRHYLVTEGTRIVFAAVA